MKQVIEHIQAGAARLATRPLLAYLRDPSIDARERLGFAPFVAHFIMTFADVLKALSTEQGPNDQFRELVRQHCEEERDHWKWFLADLVTLDLDPEIRFTDAVRFLWSDATSRTRTVGYDLFKLLDGLSAPLQLAMIIAMETTSAMAFEASATAGHELALRSKRTLVFFGQQHLDTEQSHSVGEADTKDLLMKVTLDDETRAKLVRAVDRMFLAFSGFFDEIFELRGRHANPFQGSS